MNSFSKDKSDEFPLNMKSSERNLPSSRELQVSGRSDKENVAILPEGLKIDKSRQNKLDRSNYNTTEKAYNISVSTHDKLQRQDKSMNVQLYGDEDTATKTVSFR